MGDHKNLVIRAWQLKEGLLTGCNAFLWHVCIISLMNVLITEQLLHMHTSFGVS